MEHLQVTPRETSAFQNMFQHVSMDHLDGSFLWKAPFQSLFHRRSHKNWSAAEFSIIERKLAKALVHITHVFLKIA